MSRFLSRNHLIAFAVGIVLAAGGLFAYTQFSGPQSADDVAEQYVHQAKAVEASDLPPITVYKTPTCGCCKEWVTHLENSGFEVQTTDVRDLSAIKKEHQIPRILSSCHTGIIDGYVVEGHVPASDVKRLVTEKPDVTGLTVPGMPIGSPGMERGATVQPYDVLTFNDLGQTSVYASYGK